MKKNLILLHGALGSSAQFTSLKTRLSDRFNVISFNFEGHGGRTTNKKYTIDLFTKNTIHAFEEFQIPNAHIFGYSMGGYVALNLALHYPDKVKTIVTLGTKFNWTKETAEKETRMLHPQKMMEKIPAFVALLKTIHHPIPWQDVVTNTAHMMNDLGSGNRLHPEDFKKIAHPTLIGIGTKDSMVSIEESENTSKILPNGTLMKINNAQHPIEKVDVALLTEMITTFIYTHK